jgi:signal peptidase I
VAPASDAKRRAPVAFLRTAEVLLTPAEKRRLNFWRWHDRLVSLWAPVAVLAVLFLGYTAVIEFRPCAASSFQPTMQGLAVLCFAWWAVLVGARVIVRSWNLRRRTRYLVDESVRGLSALLSRRGSPLPEKVQLALRERAATVLRAFGGPVDPLQQALDALEKHADGQLDKLGRKRGRGESFVGFLVALGVALLVRTVLIEPFRIPSGSMIPTLEVGDQIFVNKFIYGVRIPFTNSVPFVLVREPRRGDVIVFNNPVQPDRDFIKRIIGVPGDRIEFQGSEVFVNGKALPLVLVNGAFATQDMPAAPESIAAWLRSWFVNDWTAFPQRQSLEIVDGQGHWVLHDPAPRARFNEVVEVPAGSVFVMGDNRDHSADSRFGLGDQDRGVQFVPYGHIKGKAMVVWLSLSRGGLFHSVFGGTGFRLDRFAQPVTRCTATEGS